jgi:sulfite exporter TauE/SafE
MIAMVSAILVASLLGSMHCVGMCGAFVALAVGESRGWRAAAAYHGGRLISYVLLGAIAGAAGTLMNVAGAMAGIRPIAAIFAGATMVVFGGIMLLRLWGVRIAHMRLPASWSRLVSRISMKAMNRPLVIRAGMIGLATTLLPCGWLYAFAVTAAGTASPLQGAAVMAIFWLGTLPALVVVGAGVRGLLGPIGKRAPALTSLLLVIVGLYTLIGRSMLDPLAIAQRVQNKAGMTATTQPAACCTQQAS